MLFQDFYEDDFGNCFLYANYQRTYNDLKQNISEYLMLHSNLLISIDCSWD